MKTALIAFLLVQASCPGFLPQDAGAESRPASDPKAVELFKKALAAQLQGGATPVIRDLQAELECTVHEYDPKTKEDHPRSATVLQHYRDRGAEKPLFRRQLAEKFGGNVTIQGYDGERYWQKLGQTGARELRGRESKEDVDRIKGEMNRTREYLRFLFLSNLEGPGVTLRYGGPSKLETNKRERAVEIVVREHPKEGPIQLFFGDGGGKTVLYGLSRKLESGKTELIAFAVHTVVISGGATALVPLVAQYREDGVMTFEARAPAAESIKLNASIPDSTFAMPQ